VILLDLVMKGMYGLDVLSKLREMDPLVKVIVVSADVQTSSRQMVQDGGAAGFINKPASADQIVQMVEQVLKGISPWN
jgi:two-component system chemotaxis response regulator CheY